MRNAVPLLLLALAACSSQPSADDPPPDVAAVNIDAIDSAKDQGVDKTPPDNDQAPSPGTPGGLANDMMPVSEAPFTADSAQGGADVVQRYFALIEAKKYGEAWTLWEDGGKASGKTPEAFAKDFEAYSTYHANVGAPGDVDAGAGQRYVTVPVIVYGRLKQGDKRFDLKGNVTLHLTVVDGASEAQKHWHIRSVDLAPSPG
ncbi:hypothetical protein [Sphingomonas sp.]|uniref:hypothetical protein n=1 Tax=Sphingomonas sp. TaxID=28214 RepID=UPI001B248137|nr:hypothetical protein [Sphingomonas sp.]MBO9714399.1 hypothetical protein [Sphingomonas sp.]